jgi:hypothetical protein
MDVIRHLWIMYPGALAKRNFKVSHPWTQAAVTCAVTTSLTFVAQDTKAHLGLSFLEVVACSYFYVKQSAADLIHT